MLEAVNFANDAGGVEMIERKHSRARRLLRSLLIAGAGAAAWMALSATGANADSGNNHGSLLDGVKSTVASVSQGLHRGGGHQASAVPVPVTPASLPQPVAHAAVPPVSVPQVSVPPVSVPQIPVAQNVAPSVVQVLDDVVEVVPLVESVAPENPVSGVVSGVAEPLTSTIDDVAAVLPSPLAETLEPVTDTADAAVTEVLQPVTETLVDVLDLGQLPNLGRLVDSFGPAPPIDHSSIVNSARALQLVAPFMDFAGGTAALPSGLAVTAVVGVYVGARVLGPSSQPKGPGGTPSPLPAMPCIYGTGSGHAGGDGSSASAAWLQGAYDLSVRPWVVLGFPAGEQHPSPVSFDPGSSPD